MKLRQNPMGEHIRIGVREMPVLLSLGPWPYHFYGVLLDLSQKNKSPIIVADYEQLIGGFSITKRHARRAMAQLKEAGLIHVERCGNANKIFLLEFVEPEEKK